MKVKEYASDQLLLVEGSTDQFFIGSFKDKTGLSIRPKIEWKESSGELSGLDFIKEKLPVALKDPNLKSLGVVIDADSNIENAYKLIVRVLKDYSSEIPETIPVDGVVLPLNIGKKFGLWIWPDNKSTGNLETFLSSIIPVNDHSFPHSKRIVNEIIDLSVNPFLIKDREKAEIYTWLTRQKEPGLPYGKAVNFNYFNLETETCNRFKTWLQNLYTND